MKKKLLILLFFTSNLVLGQITDKIDSLKTSLLYATDSEKIIINIKLAKLHRNIAPESHFFYAKETNRIAKKVADKKYMGISLVEIGKYYKNNGNYDSAYYYTKKALPFFESKINLARGYSRLSNIQKARGNYVESIRLLIKSDSLFELEGNTRGRIASNVNLGTILVQKDDHKEALKYFEKAEMLAKNDERSLSEIYNNLALLHLKFNDTIKAKKYLFESLGIKEKLKDSLGMASSYIILAGLSNKRNNENEFITYIEKALSIYKRYNNVEKIMTSYLSLGTIYSHKNESSKAEYYLLEAEKLGKGINYYKTKVLTYKALHVFYQKTNQWEKAYLYAVKYTKLNDSVNTIEKTKTIKNLEIKYKTKEIQKAKKESDLLASLAEVKAKKNKNLSISIALLACLLLLGAFMTYYRLKTKKKHEILALRLEESENRIILEQKARLSELKALQSQMNPHFIFNALNSIQDLILLKDIKNSNKYLGKFSDFTRKVLLLSKKGFVSILEEIDVLNVYLELEQLRFGDALQVSIVNNVSDFESETIKIPTMFIQPYVENALKHGLFNKKGMKQLKILFYKEKSFLVCIIEDNGVGRNQNLKEIKSKGLHFSTHTNEERAELLNNGNKDKIEINIEDSNTGGTKVTLRFPINKLVLS